MCGESELWTCEASRNHGGLFMQCRGSPVFTSTDLEEHAKAGRALSIESSICFECVFGALKVGVDPHRLESPL